MKSVQQIRAFVVHKTRMLYLIARGIPFGAARYFAGWNGFHQVGIVRKFVIRNGYIYFDERRLPTSVIGITQNDVATLSILIEKFIFRHDNGHYLLNTVGHENIPLTIEVVDHGSLVAFFDVFVSRSYSFFGSQKYVVVDVGTNVGLAALSFASRPDVEAVFTFEIVPSTYEVALRNFSRNPDVAKKITAYNFGLAATDDEFWINASIPNTATFSIPRTFSDPASYHDSQKVVTRNAGFIFDNVIKLDESESISFVLKMDCEGSELDILRSMSANMVIERFSIIILEWHFDNYNEVKKLLLKHEFILFEDRKNGEAWSTGMIYAVRHMKR